MTADTFYRGRRVMITGGLGFIGSNLAHRLVQLGADVLLVDSLIPDYGGNLFNIAGIEDQVTVNVADVRQASTMNYLVQGRDVIFNLAGQVSHIDSMRDPHTDLEINCRSQLTLLEACRHHNPRAKVIFASTRQIYGKPDELPVTERHLVRPTDVNGINKAAGEYYHLVYNNVFGVRACALRLTNVYGPRQLLRHNRQGFIGWFVRLVLENKEIQVFGDGSQIRDFVYVDDAVEAFLAAGATDSVNGEAFNVGGEEHITHRDLVKMLVEIAGSGRYTFVEWPADKKAIDIGRLLRGLVAVPRPRRMDAVGAPARRLRADVRVLPPAPCLDMSATVPFNALKPAEDAADVRAAIDRVLASGWFILGPEVEAFEAEFAAASRVPHAVGVGTGTDAITLILRALDIGAGDEVITPPLSAAYSALAVMMAGARPVFADIDPERLTLDPRATEAAITARTRAIMPVHLYGQAADMRPLEAIAQQHNLAIVEDAAQAHLATADGRPVGTIGVAAATSFYPTKNLGAAGDGGAVLTRDAQLAARVKRLRNGGQTTRYQHDEFGVNSRLDEMQAAILRARLKYLAGMDREAAIDRGALSRVALAERARARARASSTPGTCITCSRC